MFRFTPDESAHRPQARVVTGDGLGEPARPGRTVPQVSHPDWAWLDVAPEIGAANVGKFGNREVDLIYAIGPAAKPLTGVINVGLSGGFNQAAPRRSLQVVARAASALWTEGAPPPARPRVRNNGLPEDHCRSRGEAGNEPASMGPGRQCRREAVKALRFHLLSPLCMSRSEKCPTRESWSF